MADTFKADIERLESIVAQLESGDLPLEDSLKLFEEGTSLAGKCQKRLTGAEQKIIEMSAASSDDSEANV